MLQLEAMHKHISKHPETQHLPDDVLHYREYKILLQPERFTSKRDFLAFWQDGVVAASGRKTYSSVLYAMSSPRLSTGNMIGSVGMRWVVQG